MGELFDRFEINRAPRWPLMSRLVALSLVLHGLFIVTVVYVPTLRSLLYVASNVSGINFVSQDYDPTLIGQRATIVKLEPYERLVYPPDYFGAPEVAETSQFDPMVVQQVAPPLPPTAPVYRPRRQRTPRAAAPPEATPTPTPEVASATPTPTPASAEEQKQADAEMERIAKEKGIPRPPGDINTKPFEDVAARGKELFDQGKLNLTALDVTATGELNEDGTLKPETVRIEGIVNDETAAQLAQQLITAMSQSKVLVILGGAKDVRIALKVDQQIVSIKVMSELPTEQKANDTAIGCALMVAIGRKAKQGTNEGILYENLKFDSSGKQFNMNFEMPRDAAGKVITEMLAKKAGKAATAAATPQARS